MLNITNYCTSKKIIMQHSINCANDMRKFESNFGNMRFLQNRSNSKLMIASVEFKNPLVYKNYYSDTRRSFCNYSLENTLPYI